MKRLLLSAGVVALLGANPLPASAAMPSAQQSQTTATQHKKNEDASVGQQLLKVTNDMWFLLSGITDKEDADAAAPRFLEQVNHAVELSNSLYDTDSKAQDLEAMDMMHYRVAEALDDLGNEFESLCRAQCYGSQGLIHAFHQAAEAGMFEAEDLPELENRPPLSETETRHELVRLRRLVEPDRAVLETLKEVTDSKSAAKAVPRLTRLTARLRLLQPEKKIANRAFSPDSTASVRAVYAPIEPLLWGIRSEIVRIASLPGYNNAAFDSFSDALDMIYESLGAAHSAWFNDVFDTYFRDDLNDAYSENAHPSP